MFHSVLIFQFHLLSVTLTHIFHCFILPALVVDTKSGTNFECPTPVEHSKPAVCSAAFYVQRELPQVLCCWVDASALWLIPASSRIILVIEAGAFHEAARACSAQTSFIAIRYSLPLHYTILPAKL